MKNLKKIILFVVLVSGCLTTSAQNIIHKQVESQIGQIDLSKHLIYESGIVSDYGEGYVQVLKVGEKIIGVNHVYYVPEQQLWILFEFSHVLDQKLERSLEGILITKKNLCDQKYKPIKILKPLITSKGITLGDELKKILEIYGQPSLSIFLDKDNSFSNITELLDVKEGHVLRYLPERPTEEILSEFYFENGKLHSLLISGIE